MPRTGSTTSTSTSAAPSPRSPARAAARRCRSDVALLRRHRAGRGASRRRVPVTAKFRIGSTTASTFLDAGRIAEDEGAAAVALHARTAAQHYSGRGRLGHDGRPGGGGDRGAGARQRRHLGGGGHARDGGRDRVRRGGGRPGLSGPAVALRRAGPGLRRRPLPPAPPRWERWRTCSRHFNLLAEWVTIRRRPATSASTPAGTCRATRWAARSGGASPLPPASPPSTPSSNRLGRHRSEPCPSCRAPTAGPAGRPRGPSPVTLPEGWLATAEDPTPWWPTTSDAVSGG